MRSMQRIFVFVTLLLAANSQNVLLTNDDGWAVAQIRAQNDALIDSGFSVVLSSPAENESGTSSMTATPTVLNITCEFDTCPVGSPPEGSDASDPLINYVNSFPVNAVRFGIQTLSPEFFGGPPDFVVSGPNVGNNLDTAVSGSGTVGAACEAALEGLPSTAFSGDSTTQVSFTTLTSDPTSSATIAALTYASLTAIFVETILAPAALPVLPAGVTLNVNYPSIDGCTDVDDFSWVFTRLAPDASAIDVETCGTDHLPDETTVVRGGGCHISITVIDATTKTDVDATTQGLVLDRLGNFVSCLDDD